MIKEIEELDIIISTKLLLGQEFSQYLILHMEEELSRDFGQLFQLLPDNENTQMNNKIENDNSKEQTISEDFPQNIKREIDNFKMKFSVIQKAFLIEFDLKTKILLKYHMSYIFSTHFMIILDFNNSVLKFSYSDYKLHLYIDNYLKSQFKTFQGKEKEFSFQTLSDENNENFMEIRKKLEIWMKLNNINYLN